MFARYLPALAVLNALWEVAQLPLYTLWWEAPPLSIAYTVLYCTLGDVLIGVGALLAALIVTRAGTLCDWHWIQVGTITATFGLSYTAFSEWFNTTVRAVWTYSEWMPVTPAGKSFDATCSQCHALPDPGQHTANEWSGVVGCMTQNMKAMGKPLPDQATLETVIEFLQTHAK